MITIYTDGSCNTAHRIGAWAAILFIEEEKIVLKGHSRETTHQQMELTAVTEALAYIKSKRLPEQPIHIYTDSQYIVHICETKEKIKAKDFATNRGTPMRNAALVRTLIAAVESLPVAFTKVKAHRQESEVERLNREADKLCRKIVRGLVAEI